MKSISFILVAEGSSDRVLIPILRWILNQQRIDATGQMPNFERFSKGDTKDSLREKIEYAVRTTPCDLVFVHRDVDNSTLEDRKTEINRALQRIMGKPPAVCVIPKRETESWLMFNGEAIKQAAANPKYKHSLNLPKLSNLEDLKQPKEKLRQLLQKISNMTDSAARNVVEKIPNYITDYSPLRELSAFRTLEADIEQIISEQKWNTP